MGEVLPGECAYIALGKDKHAMMACSLEEDWVHLVHKLLVEAKAASSSDIEEEHLMLEEGGEGDSPTEKLVPV